MFRKVKSEKQTEQDNNLPVEGHLVLHLHLESKADQPIHLPKIRLVFLKHSPLFSTRLLLRCLFPLTYSYIFSSCISHKSTHTVLLHKTLRRVDFSHHDHPNPSICPPRSKRSTNSKTSLNHSKPSNKT